MKHHSSILIFGFFCLKSEKNTVSRFASGTPLICTITTIRPVIFERSFFKLFKKIHRRHFFSCMKTTWKISLARISSIWSVIWPLLLSVTIPPGVP